MGNSDFLLSKGLSAGLGLGLRGVVIGGLLFETEVIGVEETTLVDIEVFDVLASIILRLSLLSDISIPEKARKNVNILNIVNKELTENSTFLEDSEACIYGLTNGLLINRFYYSLLIKGP